MDNKKKILIGVGVAAGLGIIAFIISKNKGGQSSEAVDALSYLKSNKWVTSYDGSPANTTIYIQGNGDRAIRADGSYAVMSGANQFDVYSPDAPGVIQYSLMRVA